MIDEESSARLFQPAIISGLWQIFGQTLEPKLRSKKSLNQKFMCSKMRCLNVKMFCYKNESLTGILSLMEGYCTPISNMGHRSPYM